MKKTFLAILIVIALVSCKKDDSTPQPQSQKGKVVLEFQHNYQDAVLNLNQDYTTPPPISQKLTFSRFSYIISDISLIKSDEEEVKYHYTNPNKGAFLVVHYGTQLPLPITLEDIPIGEYTKIKFRLGISNEAWKLGQENQSTFWNVATAADMVWEWAKGYKHTNFEGMWAETIASTDTNPFSFYLTSNPSENVEHSMVFTLDLPTVLSLSSDETKNIRFDVNASSVLGGKNKITLTTDNGNVNQAGEELLSKIKQNMSIGLFKAASVY